MMATLTLSLYSNRNFLREPQNSVAYSLAGKCCHIWNWNTVRRYLLVIFFGSAIALSIRYSRYVKPLHETQPAELPVITPMLWTYHFAYDNQGLSLSSTRSIYRIF